MTEIEHKFIYAHNSQFTSETITEVVCTTTGEKCGGSDFYSCHQMKAKMLVATTEMVLDEGFYELRVKSERNITVHIGCSCAYMEPVFMQGLFLPGPQEKKRSNFAANNVPEN